MTVTINIESSNLIIEMESTISSSSHTKKIMYGFMISHILTILLIIATGLILKSTDSMLHHTMNYGTSDFFILENMHKKYTNTLMVLMVH